MNDRTAELLQTMRQQALKTLDKNNQFRSTWYERCFARGQLSVLRLLEEGSEKQNANDRTGD